MLTFLDFYTTLLRFVHFRLYHSAQSSQTQHFSPSACIAAASDLHTFSLCFKASWSNAICLCRPYFQNDDSQLDPSQQFSMPLLCAGLGSVYPPRVDDKLEAAAAGIASLMADLAAAAAPSQPAALAVGHILYLDPLIVACSYCFDQPPGQKRVHQACFPSDPFLADKGTTSAARSPADRGCGNLIREPCIQQAPARAQEAAAAAPAQLPGPAAEESLVAGANGAVADLESESQDDSDEAGSVDSGGGDEASSLEVDKIYPINDRTNPKAITRPRGRCTICRWGCASPSRPRACTAGFG